MHVFETVMCGFLILFAIFLVIAVLVQHGKDHRLSGTSAGGAENFCGKGNVNIHNSLRQGGCRQSGLCRGGQVDNGWR